MSKTSQSASVYFMLLAVAALWGANVVMIKYLTHFFVPTALAASRLAIATLCLAPLVILKHGLVKPTRQEWACIAGVGMCSIFLHQIGLSWGLQATSGTHGTLILALNPLCTMLLAAKFADEPLSITKVGGILLALSGITLIVSQNEADSSVTLWGDVLMFLCMLAYVAGTLFVKKSTASVQPLVVTAYSHVIGTVSLLITAFLTTPVWVKDPSFFAPAPIAVFFASAILATALGALWWNTGIQKIGASTTAVFLNIHPIIGILTSAIFLGEVIHWQHIAALILVLTGVGVGTGLLAQPRLSEQAEN